MSDGIGERDEPRAERVNFAIEVRATLWQARVAIRYPTERGERLPGAPQASRARDQRPNALDVRAPRGPLGGPLGKVLAKGVVEAMDGGGCSVCGAR